MGEGSQPAITRRPDDLAATLRRNGTDVERALWQALRNRQLGGAKFRRQVPIGHYIVDFLCLDAMLIVERSKATEFFGFGTTKCSSTAAEYWN